MVHLFAPSLKSGKCYLPNECSDSNCSNSEPNLLVIYYLKAMVNRVNLTFALLIY